MIKKYSPTQFLGHKAEKLALIFLKQRGFKLLTQSYKNSLGEIDLIMENARERIFVEVRSRQVNTYITCIDSVDLKKQRKIIRTAEAYLQKHPTSKACRFDVIAIETRFDPPQIDWIQGAFQK